MRFSPALRRFAAGFFLSLAPLMALAQPAPSGVFAARDGNNTVIVISGRISAETETAFTTALRGATGRPRIYLSSPGGSLTPGLNMGRMIREARLETFVPAGAGCWSACGLIWLAGVERHLDPTGRVGFHAAYVPQQGAPNDGRGGQVSGSGNAVIGAYLSRLGYNDNAIRFFTSARPDQMFELKPTQFQDYGITVRQTVARQPSPSELAPGGARPVLAGIWTGQYQCGKDLVAARMAVREDGPQRFAAKFDFGPTPGAPGLPRGSFAMRGLILENGAVQFRPENLPQLPPGARPVSLQGSVNGNVFSAQVLGSERCLPVTLRRAGGA